MTLGGETEILVGFPLIYSIDISHPQRWTAKLNGQVLTPLVIAIQTGNWGHFVSLVVRDAAGKVLQWPLHLLNKPGNTPSLDAETGGHLTLFVTPEDSAALPAGHHQLDVWLDSRSGSTDSSWKGVSHDGFLLTLEAALSKLSPGEQCWQAIDFARYYDDIRNDSATAIARLDEVLAAHPELSNCLVHRAGYAERAGDICKARDLYRHALDADEKVPRTTHARGLEEPSWIIGKQAELSRRLPDGGCPAPVTAALGAGPKRAELGAV